MHITKRFIYLILIAIILFVSFSGCKKSAVKQISKNTIFSSYLDIPGITDEEIKAIEALKREYDSFVYGMTWTTEAFMDSSSGSGEVKGYSALFCNWMTEFFGIRFKPVIYSWNDLFAGLESMEIDFTGDLMDTEKRRQIYFMTQPIAQRSLKSFQIDGSLSIHEIVESRLPRLAFLGSSAVPDKVSEAVEYKFESIFVDDSISAYHKMKKGEIDTLLVMGISEASLEEFDDVKAEIFLPLVYNSASMSTQNPKLKPIISVVEKALKYDTTNKYLSELYETGYYEYRRNKLFAQFTNEERLYLQNNPVVPVGMDPGNYPGCFYDKREKQWRGSFVDLGNEVASLTGLTFKRVNNEKTEWPEIFQMLIKGDIHIVPELTQSKEREGKFIWPDSVQMIDYYTLISKAEFPNININEILHYKIGMAKNSAYAAIFKKWFPSHTNTIEYESMEQAFDALRHGHIDMVMANQKRLLYLTHYMELSDYKANIVFDQPLYIKFGINKDQPVLCSIINKALKMVDMKNITDHWMRKTYDYQRKMAEVQIPWLIGSSILFLLVLGLVIVFFARSRHAGKLLEKLVNERTRDLKLQTSMLMTIFDSSPDFIFCKDLELCYTQCNKSMRGYLSIGVEDVIGKTDIDIFGFSPEMVEGYIREDQNVIKNKKSVIFEETIESQYNGGKKSIVETIKTPLIQDGEVIGIMGISRDITKHKNTEKELAMQTSKLQAILDSIPDYIFCKDMNLNFTQCNKIMEDFYGVREEDILGKSDMRFLKFPDDIINQISEAEKAVIKQKHKSVIEEKIKHHDGITRIWETVRVPLKQDDITLGLLTITRDITKRKEMEEAALAASRSKSAFLATMSHEIRTPMNSIIGFSELALDDKIHPRTKEYLEKILENATGLLQIINDVLDISKVESGKMELEKIPFEIHDLFNSCRSLIMPKAVEKGLVMHFYVEPSLGKKPLGDPTRFRQILLNLLSNAVKFTNTGTIKLHSDIINKTEKNITMHFEIRDSGIGMTPEQQKKIFEPFIQAESGITRKYGGTGLGLTIAKNIVELMGGKLSVESALGIGSKFSFDLTFDTIDVADGDPIEKKIVFDELEKPTFKGEVLLCEDNVMNQQVICEHLARVGLKSVVAENGKVGVEKIKSRKENGEKQFDLILMDIHMPVMDGLEAADKILELNIGVPIVAMTANIMSSDREIYRNSGMNYCVGKPFTSQELWRCLMNYLKPIRWKSITGNSKAEDKLRYKLINTFLKDNGNLFNEIIGAINRGDIKLAHRMAHTLKSNAGQLGKTLLQRAAATVEECLKNGKSTVSEEQLKILETELNAVLMQFEAELKAKPMAQNKPKQLAQAEALDGQAAEELIEKLKSLLEMGNPECRELIGKLQLISGNEAIKTRLIQQIEDLDFDQAAVTLVELTKNE